PGSDGAIRMPSASDLFDLLRRGHGAFLIEFADCGANTEIADGQHVLAAQSKQEKHVRSPDTDSFYLGERGDDFFIRERRQRFEINFFRLCAGSEIANVRSLLVGKVYLAHGWSAEFEDRFRSELPPGSFYQAIENCGCRFPA